MNLRIICVFALPCAESLFREYGIATIVKWKAPINEKMVKQVHVMFETVSALANGVARMANEICIAAFFIERRFQLYESSML